MVLALSLKQVAPRSRFRRPDCAIVTHPEGTFIGKYRDTGHAANTTERGAANRERDAGLQLKVSEYAR